MKENVQPTDIKKHVKNIDINKSSTDHLVDFLDTTQYIEKAIQIQIAENERKARWEAKQLLNAIYGRHHAGKAEVYKPLTQNEIIKMVLAVPMWRLKFFGERRDLELKEKALDSISYDAYIKGRGAFVR